MPKHQHSANTRPPTTPRGCSSLYWRSNRVDEGKYGLEYTDFQRRLEAGILGDEFGHALEMDAMRWGDLIAEKKHWLQQLGSLRELLG